MVKRFSFRLFLGLAGVTLVLLLAAAFQPRSQSYAIGTPADELVALGFYPRENLASPARWTDDQSSLVLFGHEATGSLLVQLHMSGLQVAASAPTSATLVLGQHRVHSEVRPEWRIYHVLMPHDSLWNTPILNLLSSTQQPAANDQRELGVLVSNVGVQQLTTNWLALIEYALYISLIVFLLTWFVVLLRGDQRYWWLGIGVLAAIVVAAWMNPVWFAVYVPLAWQLVLMLLVVIGGIGFYHTLGSRLTPRTRLVVIGVGCALIGASVLRWSNLPWLGALGLLGGAWLVVTYSHPTDASEPPSPLTRNDWLLLAGLLLLSTALRFYRLGSVPFGLWRDEARHGLVALNIMNDPTYRPVYVLNRVDLPALLFYLQTVPLKLFDVSVWSVRSVSALGGSLTILPLFWIGRQLWNKQVGFVAAFFLACSSWNIAMSHFASPAVLDPFFTLTGLACLLWLTERTRASSWRSDVLIGGFAGLMLGLTIYTYHTGRLAPVAAAWVVMVRLGIKREAWRNAWRGVAVTACVMLLVATPLIRYMQSSPEGFNRRIDEIGVLYTDPESPSPTSSLVNNLTRYTLMWNVEGDNNARHHPWKMPMVDLFTGVFLVIGMVGLLRRWRQQATLLLGGLLVLWLVPGILSSDAPHSLRAINALGAGLLVAAHGALIVLQLFGQQATRRLATISLGIGIVGFNYWVYFGHMPYAPRTWDKFAYTRESAIADYVRTLDPAISVIVPDRVAQTDVYTFLTAQRTTSATTFNPKTPKNQLTSGSILLIGSDIEAPERAWLDDVFPNQQPQAMTLYPNTSKPTFWLYRVP